ncbi:MAG: sugar nucleotide-binding protein [Opitutales bacterium]|nr:sugar nucleotide-binding protein [Opitutales bacterium]MCH8539381.1 sugar nucleotide-binding protein [Opitutales bacterium]
MITVLGHNGYVGQAYVRFFKSQNIAFQGLSREQCDYTDRAILATYLKNEKPDFLINAAGYTGKPNVDACEDHRSDCLAGNAILPGILQVACQEAGIPWGHVSSGCIFTGLREDGSGFSETDVPNFTFRQNNCSFYSGSKALGEEVLGYEARSEKGQQVWKNRQTEDFYVWRLRIPFNEVDNPRNYLTKLLKYQTLLEAENSLSQLDHFVRATIQCWEKKIPFGTYNVTNPGKITTSEVTALMKQKGITQKEFHFFESEKEFLAKAAKTPRSNCILSTDKILTANIALPPVKDAIAEALDQWKPCP